MSDKWRIAWRLYNFHLDFPQCIFFFLDKIENVGGTFFQQINKTIKQEKLTHIYKASKSKIEQTKKFTEAVEKQKKLHEYAHHQAWIDRILEEEPNNEGHLRACILHMEKFMDEAKYAFDHTMHTTTLIQTGKPRRSTVSERWTVQ